MLSLQGHANLPLSVTVKASQICNTSCSKRPGRIMPNKCILEDRRVAITQRLRYFDAVFSSALVVFFSSAPFFSQRVWLELFYWAPSRRVPFIYRRPRMCRETGPSPSLCSLGAGGDSAGRGWGWFPSVMVLPTQSNSSRLAA